MNTNYPVILIDAWAYDEDWTWNTWQDIGRITVNIDGSTRHILKRLREEHFLTDQSKGRVYIDDDQYNLVIRDRSTREPLIAIEYGSAD